MLPEFDGSNRSKFLSSMFFAKFVSDAGTWINVVLLLLFTNEIADSKAQGISIVIATRVLMPLLFAPWIGKWVDRYPSAIWLIVCDLLAGILVNLVPLMNNVAAVAVISGLVATVTAVHFSAFNLLMKRVSGSKHIKDSILRQALFEGGSLFVGTGLAAIIGTFYSIHVGFILDSVSFFISAAIITYTYFKMRIVLLGSFETAPSDVLHGNIFALFRKPVVIWLLMVSASAAVCFGIKDTLLIQFVVNELGYSKAFYALIILCMGVGGIAGNLLSHHSRRFSPEAGLVAVFFVVSGLSLALSHGRDAGSIVGLSLILGGAEACYYYLRSVIFFGSIPEHLLAQASGVFKIFNASSRSMGVIAIGMFASSSQPSLLFRVLGGIAFLGAAVIAFSRRKLIKEVRI